MRDSLIELIGNFPTYGGTLKGKWWGEAIERLADHLLAAGVIVPPVAIGAKVYIIGWCGDIEEFTVKDIAYEEGELFGYFYRFRAVMGKNSDIHFTDTYIGKTVFLTREEAEKALAERSEG